MFTDKLFDHKYDIDALIIAFCSGHKSKKWCLNTRTGKIIPLNNEEIIDKSDNNHIHIIESLPLSFLNELLCNAKFKKLSNDDQLSVQNIVGSICELSDLTAYFNHGEAGAYIVKAIKGACLDWLDMRDLIPPSMRHTGDLSMFGSLGNDGEKIKVSIK